mgnify:CR=1 FL=1
MITLQDAMQNGHGTWRSFNCPVHPDNNPSARVNTVTGKWVCMVCHAKGKSDKYEVPERHVIDKIRNISRSRRHISDGIMDIFTDSDYWLSRFTPEACKEFELLYDPNKEKSVYPLRDANDTLQGFVYRNSPGMQPKYRYPKGVLTSHLLFGLTKIKGDVVFLVEGAPDVVAMWEAGYEAVGTFGSVLYPYQLRLLERLAPRKVIVAYDMDRAGQEGARKALDSLRRDSGLPAIRATWGGYKDAAEMPVTTRRRFFSEFLDRGLTLL